MAVAHQLAALGPARAPPGAVGDVVEPKLEHPQQVLAGDAVLPVRLHVEVAELLLEHAVDATGLLLLPELEQVLGLTDATAPVLAGRIGPLLDRALHGVALGALEIQLHPLAAAESTDGTGVTSHAPYLTPGAAWAAGSRCAGSESRP